MADHLAYSSGDHLEDTQKGKYLTFSLGGEVYGIEISYVTEIVGLQPITEVPEMPPYIQGIMNLRGKIIPLMDVRLRFRKPFREYNDRTCVIVIDLADMVMGLIVDSVAEVITIPESEIVPPPDLQRAGHVFLKGIGKVGKEVKLLLDGNKLLLEEELESIHTQL